MHSPSIFFSSTIIHSKKIIKQAIKSAHILVPLAILQPITRIINTSHTHNITKSASSRLAREFEQQYAPKQLVYTHPNRDQWPTTPKVDLSIIVPCYNVEAYIEDCINSILSQQTQYTFEIIAVDDGSTDSSGKILDKIAYANHLLKVIHQSNGGHSVARNTGLEVVTGRNIMFVDSDDIITPGTIEELMKTQSEYHAPIACGNYDLLTDDGKTQTGGKIANTGFVVGRVYAREIWQDIEFPVGYLFEDTLLAYCVLSRWEQVSCDYTVYQYRKHSSSITFTSHKSYKALDTLWVVRDLIAWCDTLSIPLQQQLFDQTIVQFGRLTRWRLRALHQHEMRAAFYWMCDFLESIDEWQTFTTTLKSPYPAVLTALRTRNYTLWRWASLVD